MLQNLPIQHFSCLAQDLHLVAFAHHRRVGAVRGSERVVHVDVTERLEALTELGGLLLVGLDLVAVSIDLGLF